MIELIVVIAILAILAAVAVPSVQTLQKTIKATDLNGAARSIYIAAQTHMSNMRNEKYEVRLDGAKPMPAKPYDYPEFPAWEDGEYCYLSKNDDGMAALLPPGAIDQTLWDGMFYIEYNVKTGMVYSVYYSEEADPFYTSDMPRNAIQRLEHSPQLGYHGGTDIEINLLETLTAPEFNIIDDDKSLRIEFAVNPAEAATYTLELSCGGKIIKYADLAVDDLKHEHIFFNGAAYSILLDKAMVGGRFKDIYGTFEPGLDIEIRLTVSSKTALPAFSTQTVNSLYAAKSGDTVMVKNMRHLQNLHTAHSKVPAGRVVNVVVGAPINAAGYYAEGYTFTTIVQSSMKSFNGSGNTITGLTAPLFDRLIDVTATSAYLVDSKIVTDGVAHVGTFANWTTGGFFTDCGVYATSDGGAAAATIESTGANYTGGFVGYTGKTTFTKCFASMNLVRAASGDVGGFVGRANDDTIFNFCYTDTGFWTATGWHRGPDSYVDVGVISAGTGYTGGFAGAAANRSAFNDCYAVGALSAVNGTAASFSSALNTSYFTNCYGAMKFVDCDAASAKLFGFKNATAATLNNCYYLKDLNVADTNNLTTYAELALCMKSSDTKWHTGWGPGISNVTNAYGLKGEKLPFPVFISVPHYGDWEEASPKIYYYEMYQDTTGKITYGFHTRFGEAETTTLLERDKLNTGNIWIIEDGYVLLSDTSVAGDKLKIDYGARKTGDSWSKAYSETLTAVEVEEQGSKHKVIGYFIRPDHKNKQGVLETIYFETYSVGETTIRYYSSVKAEGKNYYFIPLVAKGATNGLANPDDTEVKGVLEIRTARQLWEIGRRASYAFMTSTNYKQTVNIDFSKYNESDKYPLIPIASFRGSSYDGEYNVITGVDIDGTGTAKPQGGLFGELTLSSVVKNVFLISDSPGGVPRTIKGDSGSTGGITGVLTSGSTVENCVVSGFDIIGGGHVGGIAGTMSNNNTSIINSAVVCLTTDDCAGGSLNSTGDSSAMIGGLAGNVTHVSAANTSYAIVSIPGTCNATSTGLFGTTASYTRPVFTDCYGYVKKGDTFLAGKSGPDAKYNNVLQYNGTADLDFDAFGKNITSGTFSAMALAENTFPTCAALLGQQYPYPSFVKHPYNNNLYRVHFGNWFHATISSAAEGLYYFEKYSDGSYGYSNTGFSSLKDNLAVDADGYVVLVSGSSPPASVNVSTQYGSGSVSTHSTVTVDGKTFEAYYITGTALDNLSKIPTDNWYPGPVGVDGTQLTKITITGGGSTLYELYFSPHFANTVSNSAAPPAEFEIRTARHLGQLSKLTNLNNGYDSAWASNSYKQTLDIDFKGATDFFPIGGNIGDKYYFNGTYDGNGHKILNLNLTQYGAVSSATGLFGTVDAGGIVKNLDVVNCKITGGMNHVGVIAGINNGTVENCSVSNSSVSPSNDDFTGGLVGVNNGTLKGCEVKNTTIKTLGSNGSLGGLTGVNNAAATVTDCHTEGVSLNSTSEKTGGFVGENKGKISYSTAVSGSAAMSGYGDNILGGFVARNTSGSSIEHCFAGGITISGCKIVGGFAGENNGTIKNSAAVNGDYDSSGKGGGITIGDGTATGESGKAGGFVSQNTGSIEYCYALNSITRRPPSYNLSSTKAEPFYCYNSGTITNIYCGAYDVTAGAFMTMTTSAGQYVYDGSTSSCNAINTKLPAPSWGAVTPANTHAFSPALSGIAYPLPAVIKNAAGDYIHHGNWPIPG